MRGLKADVAMLGDFGEDGVDPGCGVLQYVELFCRRRVLRVGDDLEGVADVMIEFGNGGCTALRDASTKCVVLPEDETRRESDGEVLDDVGPERVHVKSFFE